MRDDVRAFQVQPQSQHQDKKRKVSPSHGNEKGHGVSGCDVNELFQASHVREARHPKQTRTWLTDTCPPPLVDMSNSSQGFEQKCSRMDLRRWYTAHSQCQNKYRPKCSLSILTPLESFSCSFYTSFTNPDFRICCLGPYNCYWSHDTPPGTSLGMTYIFNVAESTLSFATCRLTRNQSMLDKQTGVIYDTAKGYDALFPIGVCR